MIPPLVALFSWPVISAIIFQRWSISVAVIATVTLAFLFLPTGTSINLPLLPALNKASVAALSALALSALFISREPKGDVLAGFLIKSAWAKVFLVVLFFGSLLTVVTNSEPLYYGRLVLPGLRLYDGLSVILILSMTILPLFLGRKYLAHTKHHRLILVGLCYFGLAYSLLALFEIRMSPQLNAKIYGFFPHSWIQHVRGDGFRPIVFLRHGLILALFFCLCILACFGLARIDKQRRGFFLFAGVWLLGTLVLSKSLGAVLIVFVLIPVVLFLSAKKQTLVAATVCALLFAYPIIRSSNLLPIDSALNKVASYSPDRARSFQTRLRNEDLFLNRLAQKPIFGWGGWGRSRTFDERGRDITTADGHWIIILGTGGWTRYVSELGLFLMPVVLIYYRRRNDVPLETSVLTVIVAANAVDLIPNTSITPVSLLIAGALWGNLELAQKDDLDEKSEPDDSSEAQAQNRYTRQTRPKSRMARKARA